MAFSRVPRPSTMTGSGSDGAEPPPDAPRTPATGADTPTNIAYAPPPPETVEALSQPHVRATDGRESVPLDPANLGLTAADLARKYEKELSPHVPTGAGPLTTSQAIAAGIIPPGSPQGYAGTIPDGQVAAPVPPVPEPPVVQRAGVVQTAAAASASPPPPPPPGYKYSLVGGQVMLVPDAPAAPAVVVEGSQVPPPPGGPVDLSVRKVDAAPAHQPAASNTDSPSRGVPRPIDDPNKVITGGFGLAGPMYYPLDGREVRQIVRKLTERLNDRLSDDLRFTMAATYPRVGIVVEVRIDAYPDDAGFTVRETQVLAVAGRHEVESDGAGGELRQSPDAFRVEAGLEVPHKQLVGHGQGRTMVDVVPSPPGGVRAVTR